MRAVLLVLVLLLAAGIVYLLLGKTPEEPGPEPAPALPNLTEAEDLWQKGLGAARKGEDPEPLFRLALEALDAQPDHFTVHLRRAVIRMDLGAWYDQTDRDPLPLYEQARRDCDRAGDGPFRERAFLEINLGFALASRAKKEESQTHITAGIREMERLEMDEELFLAKGKALCVLGRHEEARTAYGSSGDAGRTYLDTCRDRH